MSAFTEKELEYLRSQRLGRLATAGARGRPHVVPTGFHVSDDNGSIEIGGHSRIDAQGRDRRYRRDIEANPYVAFVVDDLVSVDPWTPRGVNIKGVAEIVQEGGERLGPGFGPIWVRITPTWISSWGIETASFTPPHTRRVNPD